MAVVGIDIGGTKITVCLGELEGKILAAKRLPTKDLGSADEALPKIESEIRSLLGDTQAKGIGIAAPGPVSVKRGMILNPPNLPGFRDVKIVEYFEKAFSLPVVMNNDANACALAEWRFGAAKGVDCLIYLTMSTGLGGGIVIKNQVINGASDTAGEIGHFILNPEGPLCHCGLKGCFESYCGGQALSERIAAKITSEKINTVLSKEPEVSMKTLLSAVKQEDNFAMSVWQQYIDRLAQGIGVLIMTLNPDAVILGTIAFHAGDLLLRPLKKQLSRYAWPAPIECCRIEATALGRDIGTYSSIALIPDKSKMKFDHQRGCGLT